MDIPPYIPPPPIAPQQVTNLIAATHVTAAASIASAIITASGRPHSVAEALKVLKDVQFSMWPLPGNGVYDEWKKNSKLDQVHA